MGNSDNFIFPIYNELFPKKSPIALLGFNKIPEFMKQNNNIDLYDLSLNNWDINSDWKLNKKYKSIICTRCLYFCKDPILFLKKCKKYLSNDGEIFVDFGLGHHWTKFKEFKVGWLKNNEHEWEYNTENYLWSGIWDKKFLENDEVKIFQKKIIQHGYMDLNLAVNNEIPVLISLDDIYNLFSNIKINFKCLKDIMPQLYIFINLKI